MIPDYQLFLETRLDKKEVFSTQHVVYISRLTCIYQTEKDIFETESSASGAPEGGPGSGPPLKNHKNIGFLTNTGPDPLKDQRATKPAFNVEPSSVCQRKAI